MKSMQFDAQPRNSLGNLRHQTPPADRTQGGRANKADRPGCIETAARLSHLACSAEAFFRFAGPSDGLK